MKRRVAVTVLSLVVGMNSMGFAASVAYKVSNASVLSEGKTVAVKSVSSKGAVLYSLSDFAKLVGGQYKYDAKKKIAELKVGASMYSFKIGGNGYTRNSKAIRSNTENILVGKDVFADMSGVVSENGMNLSKNSANKLELVKLLGGSVGNALWVDDTKVIVQKDTDEGNEYYIIDIMTKKPTLIFGTDKNITEMAMSKDGKRLAFVNDNGDLYISDASGSNISMVSTDNNQKYEIRFSSDGQSVIFLMGEKIDTVASISLSDNKLTKLVDDKVPYKSDLVVSSDGKSVAYLVTKPGTTNDKDDAYTVDTSGTEPQYFICDISKSGSKPAQVTKSTDNKLFGYLLSDGSLAYISADTEKENAPLSIKKVGSNGKVSSLLGGAMEPVQSQLLEDGSMLVMSKNASGAKALYIIESYGELLKLTDVPSDTAEFDVQKDAGHIALVVSTGGGEKVSLLRSGKFVDISK